MDGGADHVRVAGSFCPWLQLHEAIRCLRVALLACLCAAFLMLAPCVAYAAQGDFASELPIVAESMSARGGASATSGPQDADNDVTFEKSGLVLEEWRSDFVWHRWRAKVAGGLQFFEGSWYWFDNSAIASASRWALDNGCWYYRLMMAAWQQTRFHARWLFVARANFGCIDYGARLGLGWRMVSG